jgi:negative regulator of sigma E activity
MSAENRPNRISGIRKIAATAAVSAAVLGGCRGADAAKSTPTIRPSETPAVNMIPNSENQQNNQTGLILLGTAVTFWTATVIFGAVDLIYRNQKR